MKAIVFPCLVISAVALSCSPQNSSLKGAWKLVQAKSIKADTLAGDFPGKWTGSNIKMWSEDYFVFVGQFRDDTTVVKSYGGGSYEHKEGNRYEEHIQFHAYPSYVGDTVSMFLEIRHDTLVQTWPLRDDGQIDKSNYWEEQYVRLD